MMRTNKCQSNCGLGTLQIIKPHREQAKYFSDALILIVLLSGMSHRHLHTKLYQHTQNSSRFDLHTDVFKGYLILALFQCDHTAYSKHTLCVYFSSIQQFCFLCNEL